MKLHEEFKLYENMWETTKEPTCTLAGEKTGKCACGDVAEEEIDKIEEKIEKKKKLIFQ